MADAPWQEGLRDLLDKNERLLAGQRERSSSNGAAPPPESDWPEPQALPLLLPPAPPFDTDQIPAPLRRWLIDAADLSKVPVEMVATPAVIGAGAVIGRSIGIQPGRYDDFVTVPNLWGATITRPGWMKTETAKEALHPVSQLIKAAKEDFATRDVDARARVARLDAEIEALKGAMKAAAKRTLSTTTTTATNALTLDQLQDRLRQKQVERDNAVATEQRYVTHDPTIEKVGVLLQENPRGLLLLRDELSGWLRGLDRAGHEGDREFYLESWNGTGSYTWDRISRGTVHVPNMTLSLYGGIQPGKFAPLIASAIAGDEGDDGLVQRLQLTVWPEALPPWSKPTRRVDAKARQDAAAIYAALAKLTGEDIGAHLAGDFLVLRFDSLAQECADDWRDGLEHRLRGDALAATPSFAAHLAKYRSLMPSLALIFHLIDVVSPSVLGMNQSEVSLGAVTRAIDWCTVLEGHAQRMYASELPFSAAHALAAKIERGAVVDGQSVRDITRSHWSGLSTPARVWEAIDDLAALGWLRVVPVSTPGRPAQQIRLHPSLCGDRDDGDPP